MSLMGVIGDLIGLGGTVGSVTTTSPGSIITYSGTPIGGTWPLTPVQIWEPVITFESLAPVAITHNPSKTVLFVWEP